MREFKSLGSYLGFRVKRRTKLLRSRQWSGHPLALPAEDVKGSSCVSCRLLSTPGFGNCSPLEVYNSTQNLSDGYDKNAAVEDLIVQNLTHTHTHALNAVLMHRYDTSADSELKLWA